MTESIPQKRCSSCKQWKPATPMFFNRDKHRPDRLTTQCKECRNGRRQERIAKNKPPKDVLPDGYKRCKACGEMKPASPQYFYLDRTRAYGLDSRCKECERARRRRPKIPEEYKRCPKCGEIKPATSEYFDKVARKQQSYGLAYRCKVCRAAYNRQYRTENLERIMEYEKQRAQRKRAEINATRRKWRNARLEKVRAYHREYYAKRREWNSGRKKKAYWKNKTKFHRRGYLYRIAHQIERSIYQKQYYESHKEQAMLNRRKRLARLRNVPGNHTMQDIQAIHEEQDGKCCYCGKDLHGKYEVDHIIPLSREGSSNSKENLALACRSCNRRKHAKTPEEWLRYRREIEWI